MVSVCSRTSADYCVGTLDNPDLLPSDVHIFIASKQPWVTIPEGSPALEEYYEREKLWPPESLARCQALLPLIEAYQASLSIGKRLTPLKKYRQYVDFALTQSSY
jgi:hypothetical protein